MKKLLTILVPAYNVSQYLTGCLQSILKKTGEYPGLEVLVINDGSEDNTGEIAADFAKRYPSTVHLVTKENGGHGSAINTGIAMASGKYLKVVDGDDWVDPNAFDTFLKQLETIHADLIYTPFVIHPEGKRKGKKQGRPPKTIQYGTNYLFSEICRAVFIRMHEMTIRTRLLEQIQIDENSYYVDMEFILFPIPNVKTVYFLPDYVYQYRIGRKGQSVSPDRMRKNIRQHSAVLLRLLRFYEEQKKQAGQAVSGYLAEGAARMLLNQFQIYFSFLPSRQIRKKMKALDQKVKKQYPEVYKRVSGVSIQILRNTGYLAYWPGVYLYRLRSLLLDREK